MNGRSALFAAGAGMAAAIAGVSPSGAAIINFDNLVGSSDLLAPTPVSTQYASLGVTFFDAAGPVGVVLGASLGLTGFSPPNVLFANQHQASDLGDLRLDFSVSATSVSLDAFLSSGYYLTASVYGAGGVELTSVGSARSPAYGVAIPFTISASSPISYLLVTSHRTTLPGFFGNFSIDNLSFVGTAVPEASTWAMTLIGFDALGLAGYRGRRRNAAAT